MMKFDLRRVAQKKGWTNVTEALVKGGIEKQKAWRMGTGRMKKWDVNDIRKVCDIFQCTPNDLFVIWPDKGKIYPPDHHLFELLRVNESTTVLGFLKSQPLENVKRIEAEVLKIRMEELNKKKQGGGGEGE
jgi:DNA-binding Xre family transcriptional regulator